MSFPSIAFAFCISIHKLVILIPSTTFPFGVSTHMHVDLDILIPSTTFQFGVSIHMHVDLAYLNSFNHFWIWCFNSHVCWSLSYLDSFTYFWIWCAMCTHKTKQIRFCWIHVFELTWGAKLDWDKLDPLIIHFKRSHTSFFGSHTLYSLF
jgi:hypothetical protein